MIRARHSMIAAVDGLYWTMVDSAHAALISAGVQPASPEEIGNILTKHFVDEKMLHKKYVKYYEEVRGVTKELAHGERIKVRGKDLDEWFAMTNDFLSEMARLVDDSIEKASKD